MIKPDIKAINADSTVDERVQHTYKRLAVFADADDRQKWFDNRKRNRELIDKNILWNSKEEKAMTDEGMAPLVINDIVKGVQGASAVATDSQPKIIAKPIGGSDLYVAELIQRGFDYVWRKNNGNSIIYKAVVEAKGGGGLAGLHCFHNPHKGIFGRIQFKNIKPTRLYFSKDSEEDDFGDSDILIAQLRSKSYILEHYDGLKEEDLFFQSNLDEEPHKSSGVTGADNYAVGDDDRKPVEGEQKNVWEIEHWQLKTVTEPWIVVVEGEDLRPEPLELEKGEKPEEAEEAVNRLMANGKVLYPLDDGYVWQRKLEKRIQKIVVGKKLISEIKEPYGMDADGDPVTGVIALKHWDTDTAYPSCPTTFALPLTKERSKRRAQFILGVSYGLNAPLVRTKDAKWVGNPGKPGSEIEIDKNIPAHAIPYRLPPENLNFSGVINLEQMANEGIDDMYDMQDVVKGKMPPGERAPSGRVVLALQDSAGMMSRPFIRNLEGAIVRLAKVIIVLMLRHWPQYMWKKLIDEDDWLKWSPEGRKDEPDEYIQAKWMQALEKVRPSDAGKEPDIRLIDLDVGIEAGSSLPTNRMAKLAFAMEMAEIRAYDAQAVLDFVDDPNKDKIIKRLKEQAAQAAQMEIMKGAK